MRSAIAWSLYQKDKNAENLRDALWFARVARDAWTGIVRATEGVYLADLTYGDVPHRRGSWATRQASVELDVRYLERLLGVGTGQAIQPVGAWLNARRDPPACRHSAASTFTPGQPLTIAIAAPPRSLEGVQIHYRHVNHAESYQVHAMQPGGRSWRFTIPPEYTKSNYALQYHFQLAGPDGTNWLYPGLTPDLANQPYFDVRRA